MELTRKMMMFLALLILPLIFFMYNHTALTSTTHFRHSGVLGFIGHALRSDSERFHMQYLSHYDKAAFDGCGKLAGMKREKGSCSFMNQTRRLPVALASFQGSGSTWVRGLLEQATGICTGSVYCDPWLRASGFSGENVRSGAVVVTKTHYPAFTEGIVVLYTGHSFSNVTSIYNHTEFETFHSTVNNNETAYTTALFTEEVKNHRKLYANEDIKEDLPLAEGIKDHTTLHLTETLEILNSTEGTNGDHKTFNTTKGTEEDPKRLYTISTDLIPHWGAAIVIVRNPFHALVAEYNRRGSGDIYSSSSHVDSLGESEFGSNNQWNDFVHEFAPQWKAVIDYYFISARGYSRLCVVFEDLKRDLPHEVMRMLDFLHVEYNELELRSQLRKTYSTFHRSRKGEFEHFTHEQKIFVNLIIDSAVDSLKDSDFAEQIPVIKGYKVSTARNVT